MLSRRDFTWKCSPLTTLGNICTAGTLSLPPSLTATLPFSNKVGRSLIVILSTNWPYWHYGGYRLSRSVTHGWFKGMLWLRGNTFLAPVSACLLFVVKSSRYRWGLNKVTEEHCSHINLSRKYEQFICNTLLIVPEKIQWLCIYLPELMCYIFFKIYVL